MKKLSLNNSTLLGLLLVSSFSFSCSKQSPNVRSIKQTGTQIINPTVTGPSVNAAAAQGISFVVVSVERPETATDGSITVTSEIKLPDGTFKPITTTHLNGAEAGGFLEMTDGVTRLDIRAGCFEANCARYILLVSTVVNNYLVHQTAVVSKISDSFFYFESINAAVPGFQFYRGATGVTPVAQVYNKYKNL